MSLRLCPECHKKVSDQAAHCVKCGYPFRKNKVRCMQSVELKKIETKLKEMQSDLEKMHQSDIDENSVSISVFKAGIIGSLAIAFFVLLTAVVINMFNVFSEISVFCVIISSVFVAAVVSMFALIFLSDLERKKPQLKKTVKCLSVICCIVICVYIVMSTMVMFASDIFIHDEKLTACSILHMLFGGLGFAISLMIQEVWHTKDKTFIFAFIALVWALIVGIVT